MLADLIDVVRELIYVQVASKSKRKPNKPKPFPRPQRKMKAAGNNFAAAARAAMKRGKKA